MTAKRPTLSVQMRGKLVVMRVGAVLLVGAVAAAAGAVWIRGAVAASHRAAPRVFRDAESPSWSPDGSQVVFTYIRYEPGQYGPVPSRYRIVRTSSKPGRAIHTVYAGRKGLPWGSMRWAAGGRIVFSVNTLLLSVSVHGGKAQGLYLPSCRPRGPGNPQCYPQGFILSPNRKIAAVFTSVSDPHVPERIALAKVNAARPAVLRTPLTAEERGGGIFDIAEAFSPDGRQLVFSRTPWDPELGSTGPSRLMAISLRGGGPVPLAQSGLPGAALVPSDAFQVHWSPDGRWVAFVENQSVEAVATAGGSAPRVLATCPDVELPFSVSWSPTAKVIAFNCRSPVNGSSQISTVWPDGTHLTDLLKDRPLLYVISEGAAGEPQWSPSGSRLLILAHRIGHRTVHVWTIRPNGNDLTQLG
jgi:hypothetical protein